jgi:hypothetical protein
MPIAKTPELLQLHAAVPEAFVALKKMFHVPDQFWIDLSAVALPQGALVASSDVAAMALRKLQGLYYCTAQGVPTTLDVLVGLASELERAFTDLDQLVARTDALRPVVHGFRRQMNSAIRTMLIPGSDNAEVVL